MAGPRGAGAATRRRCIDGVAVNPAFPPSPPDDPSKVAWSSRPRTRRNTRLPDCPPNPCATGTVAPPSTSVYASWWDHAERGQRRDVAASMEWQSTPRSPRRLRMILRRWRGRLDRARAGIPACPTAHPTLARPGRSRHLLLPSRLYTLPSDRRALSRLRGQRRDVAASMEWQSTPRSPRRLRMIFRRWRGRLDRARAGIPASPAAHPTLARPGRSRHLLLPSRLYTQPSDRRALSRLRGQRRDVAASMEWQSTPHSPRRLRMILRRWRGRLDRARAGIPACPTAHPTLARPGRSRHLLLPSRLYTQPSDRRALSRLRGQRRDVAASMEWQSTPRSPRRLRMILRRWRGRLDRARAGIPACPTAHPTPTRPRRSRHLLLPSRLYTLPSDRRDPSRLAPGSGGTRAATVKHHKSPVRTTALESPHFAPLPPPCRWST
jgi:hypothetical protein